MGGERGVAVLGSAVRDSGLSVLGEEAVSWGLKEGPETLQLLVFADQWDLRR